MISVTPIYGAVAAFLLVFLSFRVISRRRTARVGLGVGEDRQLERAIRAHGNFCEYVPLVLLLMAFAEWQDAPDWRVHLVGLLLLSGRVIHALGLGQEPEPPKLRTIGMALTFAALISSGIILLVGLF